MTNSWGGAAEATQNRRATKKKEKDIPKYRNSTHNLTWFHRSNRLCVRPWEKGSDGRRKQRNPYG